MASNGTDLDPFDSLAFEAIAGNLKKIHKAANQWERYGFSQAHDGPQTARTVLEHPSYVMCDLTVETLLECALAVSFIHGATVAVSAPRASRYAITAAAIEAELVARFNSSDPANHESLF